MELIINNEWIGDLKKGISIYTNDVILAEVFNSVVSDRLPGAQIQLNDCYSLLIVIFQIKMKPNLTIRLTAVLGATITERPAPLALEVP